MTDRRDRSADIHMRDGVLRKGRVLGHSDSAGRIREADSPLRRGEELGSLDEKQRIRRKGGLLRKGEVIARIRGNAVYTSEGLLTGGLKIGYVDENGHVWQTDSNAFRGRIVGKARGADPEAALAYFVLKFQEVEDAVGMLEEKIRVSDDKYAFLPRVRAMQKLLPEVDALGDFDSIVGRLDALEEVSATDLGHHFSEERARIVESTRQKVTPESTLEALRREFDIGVALPLEQAEALVGRVRGALGALSESRRRNRGDSTQTESLAPPPPPSRPPPPIEARDDRDETASRVEQLLEVALGPVDRLRDEIDRIRKDPEYGAEEMIERLRTAMTSVVEHKDLVALTSRALPLLAGTRDRVDSRPPPKHDSSRHESSRHESSRHESSRHESSRTETHSAPPPPLARTIDALPNVSTSPGTVLALSEPDPTGTRAFVEALLETREAAQLFDVIDQSLDRLRELDQTRRFGIASVRDALEQLRAQVMAPDRRPPSSAPSSALARRRVSRRSVSR